MTLEIVNINGVQKLAYYGRPLSVSDTLILKKYIEEVRELGDWAIPYTSEIENICRKYGIKFRDIQLSAHIIPKVNISKEQVWKWV
ncbi:MAG: hypothetical protein DRP12_03390 [Candidatus Aenigmatarchaeota archaeon]|nr:MAG: hypothetical protein DRP12_03390 [Candidatus Aenigmarchaeota archaeon]